MWQSLFSSRCEEWERSFECRKALVEVQMAKMTAEAEEMATEAEKRAAEAEKRAAEDLERATEAEKRAAEVEKVIADLLVRSRKRVAEAEEMATEAEKRAAEAEEMATEAEKRAAEAEEMAELAVINGSNGECFERFKCPITQRLIKDPVITCDGHTYEREAIEEWFVTHDTSPLTGAALRNKSLVPNYAVRKAIEVYVPPKEVYVPPHKR
tara:strand:- start:1675 stop:2307 length:633 start_codon:yes stop_codon:yes gene_type:complete